MRIHRPQLWNETVLTPKMPQRETSAQWTPCCVFDEEIRLSPRRLAQAHILSQPLAGVITQCLLSPAQTLP